MHTIVPAAGACGFAEQTPSCAFARLHTRELAHIMIISTSTDFCPRQPRPTLAEVPCRGFAPARVDGYFCYGIVPLPTRDTGFRATTKRLTFPTWGHGDAPHRPWCAFYSFFVYILLFCLAAVYTWYYTPRPQNIYTFETATVQPVSYTHLTLPTIYSV